VSLRGHARLALCRGGRGGHRCALRAARGPGGDGALLATRGSRRGRRRARRAGWPTSLNRRLAFAGTTAPHAQALPRFVLTAALGAACSGACVWAGTTLAGVHYLVAQAVRHGAGDAAHLRREPALELRRGAALSAARPLPG
jgi:hypothetical protein